MHLMSMASDTLCLLTEKFPCLKAAARNMPFQSLGFAAFGGGQNRFATCPVCSIRLSGCGNTCACSMEVSALQVAASTAFGQWVLDNLPCAVHCCTLFALLKQHSGNTRLGRGVLGNRLHHACKFAVGLPAPQCRYLCVYCHQCGLYCRKSGWHRGRCGTCC